MTIISAQAKVIKNAWVNDEYKHLVIATQAKASEVNPGQFFNLTCPINNNEQPFFSRPMSTYNADGKGQIEFLYKVLGKGTRTLATLTEGGNIKFLGPLGKGFKIKNNYQHILIIGRGVGLATLAPLAEHAAKLDIKITAILSAKDKEHIMSRYRFEKANANIIEAVDTDGSSAMEQIDVIIRDIHTSNPIDCFYTCGSRRIVGLLKEIAIEFDIAGEVALEEQMSCGLGMCCGCVKTMQKFNELPKAKKVCKDGPVFDLMEVIV